VWFKWRDGWLYQCRKARLAQSVERQTLNLVVEGSSPSVGASFACCNLICLLKLK
jgi:hypothetical protein